ncbi:hypothetical protein MERGE_001612 [Pneumocystis wakefieldiae]|uniref:F-box domain-containing protein n=1 Tax=Pneumocystis wakefieldiae TaxID=38082 RepID=A0A899FW98_9ASCO|nr:hypothetical protein MERGE_001612 [Pneumocystis wakefieldiae]
MPLVCSFKDIYYHASPYHRRLMIDTLFIESSPADLWYIHQKLINKKSYYFDILGHLPYELLEMVFKHLNIQDIITFSMKGTLKSFNVLYPYNKTTHFSLYTRLHDHYLILYNHSITESSNKGITLYRLKSGISQKDAIYISTENYGGMLNVSLDSYILVGVNYFGVFYIWSLNTLELIDTFKLGSSDVASMACHNNNICINTFSKTLEQIDPNLPKKCNIIAMEFLKNDELILCVENMTSNNEISYYQYRIYALSSNCGRILRYRNKLMIFYELNSDRYLKMDLKTMHTLVCLFHKNHIQELEYLVYPQSSFIIKHLKSIDNSSDNGLYIENCDPETGLLLSKNRILGSENIIYDQPYLKNRNSLQGNDNWIVYNHQNKVFLWEL